MVSAVADRTTTGDSPNTAAYTFHIISEQADPRDYKYSEFLNWLNSLIQTELNQGKQIKFRNVLV